MDHLTQQEENFLGTLSTPQKIQNYLDSIPFNHEETGETCRSPREVLIHKKAHCLEGAMLASVALMLQGQRPYILSLKVLDKDYDHVIALYKQNGYWGAISKTNHAVLGFRDPIYKTIRELAVSYFHEYFLVRNGEKTLRGYSHPINMKRFGTSWITSPDNLFTIAEAICDAPHRLIIPKGNEQYIRRATSLERETASISHDGK
jgi:hypothetical protein